MRSLLKSHISFLNIDLFKNETRSFGIQRMKRKEKNVIKI